MVMTYIPFDALDTLGVGTIFEIFGHILYLGSGTPLGLTTDISFEAPWHQNQECIWLKGTDLNSF